MNISIDLTAEQIQFLQKMLETGQYRSRSEVVRDIVRRAEFEWSWKKGMAIAAKKNATEDIEAERDAAFQVLGRRFQK